MGNEQLKKMNILERVKNIMAQPLSELECRDAALSYLEQYYDDFGFDAMENQVSLMADAYDHIVDESGIDYGGVEMQDLLKSEARQLRLMANDIRKISEKYRKYMLGQLNEFKSEVSNIEENPYSPEEDEEETPENSELNESIEKIKTNFKRFL
jgi:hypothetical protein